MVNFTSYPSIGWEYYTTSERRIVLSACERSCSLNHSETLHGVDNVLCFEKIEIMEEAEKARRAKMTEIPEMTETRR